MTHPQLSAILSSAAAIDLSSHLRLRFSGSDRLRYLNGQLTNDVTKASPTLILPAAVTNLKGRLEGIVHLHSSHDAIFLDAPASLRDSLPPRLEKYIIADDVTVDDLSDSSSLIHVAGRSPDQLSQLLSEGEHSLSHPRFGIPGSDIWSTPDRLDFWLAQFPPLSPSDAADLMVLHAIPDWDRDLSDGILPPEARLESTHIDYHKGCYIGQEVISRMRTAGKTNRLLVPVRIPDSIASQGWQLFLPDAPDSPVGTLSSTAFHPDGGAIALAWLRRDAGPGPWQCLPPAPLSAPPCLASRIG